MKNDPTSDNKLMQSLLDTLVAAGWMDKAALVDSARKKRGKIHGHFTKLGHEKMLGFKQISDTFRDFDDLKRLQFYAVLEHWNSIAPPPEVF